MRLTHLLILIPSLVLTACAKKDLEPDPDPAPTPAPAPVASAEPPALPSPGANNPFRVPDATSKLPDAEDTRAAANSPIPTAPTGNDTATVTVRPPSAPSPANGNTE